MLGFKSLTRCIAYETRYLMRPRFWPPTQHPVPDLWDRARTLFADMLRTVGNAMLLAHRQVYARAQRHDLLLRLEPVEKLVRALLCIEAITLLLMTPQGVKIRHTTPSKIPEPPPQVGKPKPKAEASRIDAAMMTIAANHPRIDPRVAERELRERLAAFAAKRAQYDVFNPPPLNGCFTVIRWIHDPSTRIAPGELPHSLVLDDHTLNTMRITIDPPDDDQEGAYDLYGPMLSIARRIDALERVLANPLPVIRRLARFIASIPRDCYPAPWPQRWRATRWRHGCPEYYNACIRAKSAFAALDRAYAMPPDDPG